MIKIKSPIINGRGIADAILSELKDKIDERVQGGHQSPKLAIILVGDDEASKIYVQNKIKAAFKVGILTELIHFDSNIEENTLLNKIDFLNKDKLTSGIIVQLPLPKHINKLNVIISIDPSKDVDGFHPINVGLLYNPYKNGFVPCTAIGCLELIKSCVHNLSGKHAVIVGRSSIVGRPLAALLLKEDCTVTICHSKTESLSLITSKADIVVAAIGSPKFFTKEYFNKNAVVIDVGINRKMYENKCELVGDVDFNSVYNHVKYITPVPGGVGPMTVAYLLMNTYNASLN